jgi:glyoxylase-like metal-dependent hydrolase (beta-lactamase superfamily II)
MEDIKTIELTFVNAFLVKVTGGFILIDTGLSMHWENLENKLIAEGCLPDKLKLVLITHGDFDHTGNCTKLKEKYNCIIAMHTGDRPMVEKGVVVKRKLKSFRNKIFFLIRKLFRKKFTFNRFSPDILLSDGQRLDEYGFNAVVVHIPGHTKGSIGILTGEGNFFAGDTFTNRNKPDTASIIENQDELDNSLARLKNMDIKMIFPGHGKPFEIGKIAGIF